MILNISKTKLLHISPHRKLKPLADLPDLYIKSQKLDYVNSFKYLGIALLRKLFFQQHFNETMSTLNSKIFLLCKIRNFLTVEQRFYFTKVTYCHILSTVEYGSSFLFLSTCPRYCHKFNMFVYPFQFT